MHGGNKMEVMKDTSRKRDLESWELAECAAVKAAIEAFNAGKPRSERITQEQAAARLEISQGAFSNYLNGRLALNMAFAAGVRSDEHTSELQSLMRHSSDVFCFKKKKHSKYMRDEID